MKTDKYKYVVLITTNIHVINETRDWEEPLASTFEEIEFAGDNLLNSREKALKKAEYFESFFAEQPDPIYPMRKWNTIEDGEDLVMIYQIQVFLKGEELNQCIYDDGDGTNDQSDNIKVFENLINEYKEFQQLGIDTSEFEEVVNVEGWEDSFFEWEGNEANEVKILSTGIDWNNPDFFTNLSAADLALLNDEPVQQTIQKKTNKKIEYKTTSIHRIKRDAENIEISVKTTSEIPKEIQSELIKLIDKWKKLNS
jgi:hypothetical protein